MSQAISIMLSGTLSERGVFALYSYSPSVIPYLFTVDVTTFSLRKMVKLATNDAVLCPLAAGAAGPYSAALPEDCRSNDDSVCMHMYVRGPSVLLWCRLRSSRFYSLANVTWETET